MVAFEGYGGSRRIEWLLKGYGSFWRLWWLIGYCGFWKMQWFLKDTMTLGAYLGLVLEDCGKRVKLS
jgi:hypothetical protein